MSKEPKTKVLKTRLSARDLYNLQKSAEKNGQSVSAFVRESVLKNSSNFYDKLSVSNQQRILNS